jgi:dienelactone hydrolase
MGGALTVASAVRIPEVDAAVSFYGIPPPELADPTQAKAPVQAHFGENDPMKGFSDPEVNVTHGFHYRVGPYSEIAKTTSY